MVDFFVYFMCMFECIYDYVNRCVGKYVCKDGFLFCFCLNICFYVLLIFLVVEYMWNGWCFYFVFNI